MGNEIIERLKARTSIYASGVRTLNRVIGPRPLHCCLFRGPSHIVASISSPTKQEAIVSCFHHIQRHMFPIKELSCRSRKLLLIAGSKRLSFVLARPHRRIRGRCRIMIHKGFSRGLTGGVRGNMGVSDNIATPYRVRILNCSTRGGGAELHVMLRRKGGHRVHGVVRVFRCPIFRLGHVECDFLALSIGHKRCHHLATTRMGGLCRLRQWGDHRCQQQHNKAFNNYRDDQSQNGDPSF